LRLYSIYDKERYKNNKPTFHNIKDKKVKLLALKK
jgi:hypothetical protein